VKQYTVRANIIGVICRTVEAENEDDARNVVMDEFVISDIEEWEVYEKPCRGNVCCRPSPWTMEITEE
jgi:hypothetical protein